MLVFARGVNFLVIPFISPAIVLDSREVMAVGRITSRTMKISPIQITVANKWKK
jgi:hypothetical protein